MKFCNFAAIASLTFLVSACGGTDSAGRTDSSAAGLSISASASHPDVFLASQARTATVVGGGAAVHTQRTDGAHDPVPTSRVLHSNLTDPDVADDVSRAHMALTEVDYEKSFSMEKSRQQADEKEQAGAVQPGEQQAYVPHPDCFDQRLAECAGTPVVAQQ